MNRKSAGPPGPPRPTQNRDREGASQATYLITFVCYGSWLPGQAGAVDRTDNVFGSRLPDANPNQQSYSTQRILQPPYLLDSPRRKIVLEAIKEVCCHRHWNLVSAHVRTNHVHIVIAANQPPEHVMTTLKAYASRALNQANLDGPDRRRWARHGSTRHLWTKEAVSAAVHYVVCEQGEPMEVWETP